MKIKILIFLLLIFTFFQSFKPAERPPLKLSDYGFFSGDLKAQIPAESVYPYSLKSALFTDYAEKLRFVSLPKGLKIGYDSLEVLNFPVGSTLIKTFYYPVDFRKPEKGRQLIETRLLIHENEGWKALDYVWNTEQTEAFLEVAGDSKEVKYTDLNGKKKKHLYGVPNVNQCKGCHNRNEVLMPIGPSARQLNSDLEISSYLAKNAVLHYKAGNQLETWETHGLIENLPEKSHIPSLANWQDETNYTLDERARAWLDINCAHCHRPEGPANSSGLNLSIHNTDKTTLGILKAPVATGRASGEFSFDIVPGRANASILVSRLASTDPGIMMPELGRKIVHEESLALIIDWIDAMKN